MLGCFPKTTVYTSGLVGPQRRWWARSGDLVGWGKLAGLWGRVTGEGLYV